MMNQYKINTTAGVERVVKAENPIEAIKSLCPNEELSIKSFKKAEANGNVNTIVTLLDGQKKSVSYYLVESEKITALGKVIENAMYEVEYAYTDNPDWHKAKDIMHDLIYKGIDIKTNEFKKEWVKAHNRREKAMWGTDGDATTFKDFTANEKRALKEVVKMWERF